MSKLQKYKNGFTLVELVIVITILTILSTIAFVSFQNYTKDARDANRIGSINSIQQGLHLSYAKEGGYPIPENYISIYASGNLIGYQGVFGDSSSRMVNLNNTPIDPLEKTYFTYNLNASGEAYQIIGFFENNAITFGNIFTSTSYASNTNYNTKTIKSYGDELGILVGSTGSYINTPLQELTNNISFSGIDLKFFTGTLSNGTNIGELKAVLNNNENDNIIGTGSNLIRLENIYKQKMQVVMYECPNNWSNLGLAPSGVQSLCSNGITNRTCSICEGDNNSVIQQNTIVLSRTGSCNNPNFIDIGNTMGGQGVKCDSINKCNMCKSTTKTAFLPGMIILMTSCPSGWNDLGYTQNNSGQATKCLYGEYCKICQKK